MRIVLGIALPLLAALLQGSVVPWLTIAGARPSLPILVAGSWSIAAGAREAVWWAFVGGIATDLLSSGPLGAQALAALPAVAAIGVGERSLARPRRVLAGAIFVGLAALAAAIAYAAILALTGHPLPPPLRLVADSIGGAVYTAGLALIVYPLARILRRVTEKQSSLP